MNVLVHEQASSRQLHITAMGVCFGEMSFFTKAPASANVMVLGKVVAWAIPHGALRQFIESHSGGACTAINIASLLARRVPEGNTRLMGINASLSAYFGHAARALPVKGANAPKTSEHAASDESKS